jgi:DivIVA domain-containing protein
MDQDDPERRIAELERQLAEQKHTSEQVRNVAFSDASRGRGYHRDEVDAFLDRVKAELSGRVPGQRPEEPIRCLLYRYASWDQQTPVLAIDVGKDALRVIDLNGNALIASVSLAEVNAQPAQYSGIPVLIVDGPGLPTLTIIPHPPPGQWRTSPKSTKPAYSAVEANGSCLPRNSVWPRIWSTNRGRRPSPNTLAASGRSARRVPPQAGERLWCWG